MNIDNELFRCSELDEKRRLQFIVAQLDGDCRVTIKPGRPGVTDPQRRYWWGVIVAIFADFMREHDPSLSPREASDAAHIEIKRHVLPEPVKDDNGRIIAEKVGSLRKIDKKRMAQAIDDAINWCGSEWGLAMPPPSHTERYGNPDETEAAA